MSDRISSFGRKPGDTPMTSEENAQPTPRAKNLSRVGGKHTRVPSLGRQGIDVSRGQSDLKIPTTPRKPDDQDFADDRGSESEPELKTLDFDDDTLKDMPRLPAIPSIAEKIEKKREMFSRQTALTTLRTVVKGEMTKPWTSQKTPRPGVAKKLEAFPPMPPLPPPSSVKMMKPLPGGPPVPPLSAPWSGKPLPEPPSVESRAKPQDPPPKT